MHKSELESLRPFTSTFMIKWSSISKSYLACLFVAKVKKLHRVQSDSIWRVMFCPRPRVRILGMAEQFKKAS